MHEHAETLRASVADLQVACRAAIEGDRPAVATATALALARSAYDWGPAGLVEEFVGAALSLPSLDVVQRLDLLNALARDAARRHDWVSANDALCIADELSDPTLHARQLGRIRRHQASYAALTDRRRALSLHREALALHRAAGDPRYEAITARAMSVDMVYEGDPEGDTWMERAVELAAAGPFPHERWLALANLAIRRRPVDADEAVEMLREALDLQEPMGPTATRGRMLRSLGQTLHQAGRLEEACVVFAEALSMMRRAGVRREIAVAEASLGVVLVETGKLQGGLAHLQRVLGEFGALEDHNGRGYTLVWLGWVHGLLGDRPKAEALFDEAEEVLLQFPTEPELMVLLGRRAVLRYRWGDGERARADLARAERFRRSLRAEFVEFDRQLAWCFAQVPA